MNDDILDKIKSIARLKPDNIAIIDDKVTVTYEKLIRLADQLATGLKTLNIEHQDKITVAVKQSPMSMALHLALMQIGAICVPMDYRIGYAKITEYYKSSQSKLLITDHQPTQAKKNHLTNRINIDQLLLIAETALFPIADLNEKPTAANISYIFYTSGSESEPKGVVIGRAGLNQFITQATDHMQIRSSDRIFQYSNAGFISSVGQIYCALTNGAAIRLHNFELTYRQMLEVIAESKVTIIWVTTFVVQEFMIFPDLLAKATKHLRLLRVGGEPLTRSQANLWFCTSNVPILNSYGPTEALQDVCAKLINSASVPITIGKSLPGVQVLLAGEDKSVSEKNQMGQMVVLSDGLSLGYYDNDELTDERFTRFNRSGESVRGYFTGDLAERLSSGEYRFLGRIKDRLFYFESQIDVDGVIASLERFDQINFAFCIGDSTYANGAIFFYVSSESVITERVMEEIILRHDLPANIEFIRLDHLPLTHNDKLNRSLLHKIAADYLYNNE